MHNNEFYVCRVCGAEQLDPPWGEDSQIPNYDICDCCGVEFGYEDMNLESIKRYRQKWLDSGANWFRKKNKPESWSLDRQLQNIPKQYR
ncbi:MAG: hypothetical protein E7D37_04275 [Enterobacter cloacae]|nr:hypothetical protein [Enterobacter cloacae]MDU2519957.1 hypothetical protein [Enterobacter cloacae]MDU2665914.1 hypothetical protein [Enterobacter cloacae]